MAETGHRIRMVDVFADWTRRLKASDETALDDVMHQMHPVLLRYTTQLVNDRDAAYDILQEAFITLWKTRDKLDAEKSLKALLYRIVYTRSLNYRRMKKREQDAHSAMAELIDTQPAFPSQELDARQLGELMHRWIAELPPRRQEAFRLSRFEGLSHQEIASIMNLSVQTVTKHIMLALQFLREQLKTYQTTG